MDLSLVLPGPGGFNGPPFPGESHIPALILGILERCVIVLQYYLCKDTIPAPAIGLREETEQVSYVKAGQTDCMKCSYIISHLFNRNSWLILVLYNNNIECFFFLIKQQDS